VTSLRLAFAGTPQVAVPALEALLASQHEVVAVLTKPDAPAGRGRALQPSAVASVARDLGLDVHTPERLDAFADTLREWDLDAVAVVAYGLLVPASLLDVPRTGWINAHFSKLPRWRGAAPVQYAIAHGDATTAVTTFRIDSGLDTGPILLTSPEVAIGEREDAGQLLARLAPIGAELLVETMDALAAGVVRPTEQASDGVLLAPRIDVADARIDWSRSAIDIDRAIRACTPAPGAWTTFAGERLRIGVPAAVTSSAPTEPGGIHVEGKKVLIATADGSLELDQVQPAGKKQMPADAWIRGLRTGDRHVH